MVVVRILRSVPPYGVLRGLVHNDVLVLRGTSGVDTSHNVDCTELGLLTFLITGKLRSCLLIEENFIRWVVKDFFYTFNSILA